MFARAQQGPTVQLTVLVSVLFLRLVARVSALRGRVAHQLPEDLRLGERVGDAGWSAWESGAGDEGRHRLEGCGEVGGEPGLYLGEGGLELLLGRRPLLVVVVVLMMLLLLLLLLRGLLRGLLRAFLQRC